MENPRFGVNNPIQMSHLKKAKIMKKYITIRLLSEHCVRMAIHFFVNFDVFNRPIGHFTVVCSVPLNASEAAVELGLIQTSLLVSCKCTQ